MKTEDIFEEFDNDYLKFERIEDKRSTRPDLHAFMLLDELFPGNRDMVGSAEHDEFWLDIDIENIEKLSRKQILELVRCGVRYDAGIETLCMFI